MTEVKPAGFGLFETLLIATPGYIVIMYSLLFLHLYVPKLLPVMVPDWLITSLILLGGVIIGYVLYVIDIARFIDDKCFHFMEEISRNTTNTLCQPCKECERFRDNKCQSLIWDQGALWDLFFYYVDSKLPFMWRDLAFWTGPMYFLIIYVMFFSLIFSLFSSASLALTYLTRLHISEILSLSLADLGSMILSMSTITWARLSYTIAAIVAVIITYWRLHKGRVGFLNEINRRQLRFIRLDPEYRYLLCKIAATQPLVSKEEPSELLTKENEEIKQIKNAYSHLALKAPSKLPESIPELNEIVKTIQLKKDSLVLDMGCGYGKNSAYFYKHNIPVVGVDYDLNQLKKAVEYAKKEGYNFEVVNADVRYPPFKNLTFDLLLLNSVIFHFPTLNTRRGILIGAWKIMQPFSHILVDTENLYYVPHFLKALWMCLYTRYKKWLFIQFGDSYIIDKNTVSGKLLRRYARFQTREELVKLLDQANFQLIKIYDLNKQKRVRHFKEIRATRISILCCKN